MFIRRNNRARPGRTEVQMERGDGRTNNRKKHNQQFSAFGCPLLDQDQESTTRARMLLDRELEKVLFVFSSSVVVSCPSTCCFAGSSCIRLLEVLGRSGVG